MLDPISTGYIANLAGGLSVGVINALTRTLKRGIGSKRAKTYV